MEGDGIGEEKRWRGGQKGRKGGGGKEEEGEDVEGGRKRQSWEKGEKAEVGQYIEDATPRCLGRSLSAGSALLTILLGPHGLTLRRCVTQKCRVSGSDPYQISLVWNQVRHYHLGGIWVLHALVLFPFRF